MFFFFFFFFLLSMLSVNLNEYERDSQSRVYQLLMPRLCLTFRLSRFFASFVLISEPVIYVTFYLSTTFNVNYHLAECLFFARLR